MMHYSRTKFEGKKLDYDFTGGIIENPQMKKPEVLEPEDFVEVETNTEISSKVLKVTFPVPDSEKELNPFQLSITSQ